MRTVEPCPVCPSDRQRIPRHRQVCEGCRARVTAQLAELPELVEELMLRELVADDAPRRTGADPVADELPAASIPSKRGERITGSRERPAPLPLDVVDLTAPARHGTVHDPWHDQYGYISVATKLDSWAVSLWEHRKYRPGGRGEYLPRPNVRVLTRWLLDRLDDAFDSYPGVAELAAEIRDMRTALRVQLGLIAWDDELKDGVTCPKCDCRAALHQANGSDRIECAACGLLLTIDEYNRWAGLLASPLRWIRGEHCETCRKERLYVVKEEPDEIRCGWCEVRGSDAD